MRGAALRIGQFVSHYPYPQQAAGYFAGGTGEVARGLSRALVQMGHEVHVIAVSEGKRSTVERQGAIAIHRAGTLVRVAQANLSASILWRSLSEPLDIVHVHLGNPPAPLAGYLYARRHGIPLVVTYHGDPQAGYGSLLRRAGVMGWNLAISHILHQADCILCPSAPFVPYSRHLKGYEARIEVVPNGFDEREHEWPSTPEESRIELGLPSDATVILYLGSFSPYKAPDLVVASSAKVLGEHSDAWLVMAGSGAMETDLRRAAARSGVGDRMKFLGFVTGDDKRRAFRAADVFVLPSVMTTEVFPLALVEASTFGLPLLVSDLPTFRSIVVPGENGLVARAGDAQNLAKKLSDLVADPAARHRLGRAAMERISRYTWSRIAARHEEIYYRAINPAA